MAKSTNTPNLTAARARELFDYAPATGTLLWKETGRGRRLDRRAGTIKDTGHLVVSVDYRTYYVHRVIYLMMTGEWPSDEIDHRNCDAGDNRWETLRPATRGQNQRNKPTPRNNTSGVKGVSWYPSIGKWGAEISVNRKKYRLGFYQRKEDAAAAYAVAALQHHKDFARLG